MFNKIMPSKFFLILLSAAALASIFLSLYISGPYIFSRKITGTFEYVRRGEEYLDKNNFKAAIDYFERAYESSPDNQTVKLDLAYAYSQYARFFSETENYDSAVKYLTKAYEILRDTGTRKNLAVFYSKKALSESKKGKWAQAAEDFKKARAVAYGSEEVSSALAHSIYNDAIFEYKEGRESEAIRLLKESLAAEDAAKSLELLGDIHYKRTDLEKSEFYWLKALELDSANTDLAEKVEKVRKEIELQKTERKKGFLHFDLRYDKSLDLDAQFLNEVLEKAYFEIGRDLSYFPSSKTQIFFYSHSDFVNIFKMPLLVGAFYDGNIRMPLPGGNVGKDALASYIHHEYAHVAVSVITNNNCPVWFNEGVAMWAEYKDRDDQIKALFSKFRDISYQPSLAQLEKAFNVRMRTHDMRLQYLAAYTVVKFIVDIWGVEGLRNLLKRLAGGQHIMNAIDDEFLLSEKEFERRWAAYLRRNY